MSGNELSAGVAPTRGRMRVGTALGSTLALAAIALGLGCASSPTCPPEVCTVLASAQGAPSVIAADGVHLYWASYNENKQRSEIVKLPLAGGALVALTATDHIPFALAVDATSVYWTELKGTVAKVPLAGGVPVVLAVGAVPGGIAVDATDVYFTEMAMGSLDTVPRSGAWQPTILASGLNNPLHVAVDASFVYWTSQDSTINRVVKTGGPVEALASWDHAAGGAIAIAPPFLYWTTLGRGPNGTIRKVPLAGGDAVILARDQAFPLALAVDDEHAFWVNRDDGTVKKVALAGGDPITIAVGQSSPVAVVIDTTSVYWANQGDGSIMKAAK